MPTRPRVWILPPLFKFALALIYTMRRVKCPDCGVVVEKVPWATGKHSLCDGFRLLLARWARKLSWDETADSFHVSWADVYALGAVGRGVWPPTPGAGKHPGHRHR